MIIYETFFSLPNLVTTYHLIFYLDQTCSNPSPLVTNEIGLYYEINDDLNFNENAR